MAMRGGPRLAVGSAPWVAEERSSALEIAHSEIEEFSYSARNELDWLNEHMAEIFSENQVNVAELFKTPGKLRGKTPRTAKKIVAGEPRVPLSDVFSSTPKDAPNRFTALVTSHSRTPKFAVAHDEPQPAPPVESDGITKVVFSSPRPQSKVPETVTDSGYHGSPSQSQETLDMATVYEPPANFPSSQGGVDITDFGMVPATSTIFEQQASPTIESEDTFQSAKEEQTRQATLEPTSRIKSLASIAVDQGSNTNDARAILASQSPLKSPLKSPLQALQAPSPRKPVSAQSSPLKLLSPKHVRVQEEPVQLHEPIDADDDMVDVDDIPQSPSEKSSPIRPMVRKSSLAFATLPAREPLTSNKSLGGRMSRVSHLDQLRTSYYSRATGGKSLGHPAEDDSLMEDNAVDDVEDEAMVEKEDTTTNVAAHNKTYTQRLQDQISMLGKSQANGPRAPRPVATVLASQTTTIAQSASQPAQVLADRTSKPLPPSPKGKQAISTPGAFPADDDDDWIAPPPTARTAAVPSPRPAMPKSYTADVMEGVVGQSTIGQTEFTLPKSRPSSPKKHKAPEIPERTTSAVKHSKSASVPSLPIMDVDEQELDLVSPKKGISVSNPPLASVSEDDIEGSPFSKSPSRTLRDSPLKQVKNKLSSILKSSKGLLASSAAISAEGKSSLLSPSTTRLGLHLGPSVESFRTAENVLYPELPQVPASPFRPASPTRSQLSRKTRASAEREKREAKGRDKEAKEVKRQMDQMDKLDKARKKEEEKARVFSAERERLEAEKKLAAQKEQERQAFEQAEEHARVEAELEAAKVEAHAKAKAVAQAEADAAAASQAKAERDAEAATQVLASSSSPTKTPAKSPAKPSRTSPRKTKGKAGLEGKTTFEQDLQIDDAPVSMPPPSVPRSAASTAASRGQVLKRPLKPAKDGSVKAKQAPTLIRVNTTSSQQSQYHPSNNVLGSTLQDTLGSQSQSSQRQVNNKTSHPALTSKPSLQSLKGSVSGRPKALELAAKRKEQEEREAQRKRDAKAELERKRAVMQEEEKKREHQRRAETEKQRDEEQRQATLAQTKKDAQRQAAIEKAKQTRAPPPAVRSQPNGPPDYNVDKGPARPPSRLGSTMHQDSGRPVSTLLSNASKMPQKRPIQQDDEPARGPIPRNGLSFQAKETKRIRMTEEFDEDIDMADSQRNPIKGPPVRPSTGFKKTAFTNGYTTAPPQSITRDLFKTTVTAQHNTQTKVNHPLDMAQLAKGAIPFAPNPNLASSHKTPARPAGISAIKSSVVKSTAKSARASPRFQNGEAIELPDIDTDDEDEDDDAHIGTAAWADSPDLRRALMRQEAVDPMQIFGPPAPLNLEEVFNKSKDRWHKFRARTSSANWSGADKLTEDDIRKDLQARDKMRREGGWSYDVNKDAT